MWKSKTPRRVLGLQPLTPEYVEQQHKLYSDELVALLNDDERRKNLRNIALTGNYGSGKSSVLTGVRAQLKKKRVVQVSLSALSDVGVNPTRSNDPRSLGLTNYIQKEIVKQLLYQERPTKVQGSRFRRLSRPAQRRAAWISLLGAAVVVGVLWLTGWGAPLALDPSVEGQRPFILAGIGLFAALALYFGQLLFANKWRLDKIGTASTSISLAGGDNADTYFDEYLDEIVYFFEMTRRDVVIIEDLDRFEDPSIYASLRELNTLLNASGQLRSRPVHFIYAVRDSIFEDLEEQRRKRTGERAAPANPDEQPGVWQAEKRLAEPATQRTKFFDLVIPIVPFITHRSSTELLSQLMADVDPKVTIGAIRVVAKHVTDMRLLRNIANEYRVFRARVLGPNTPKGLTEDKLFAVIAYKNTHLEDFEQIRVSASDLDRIYRRSRRTIAEGLAGLAAQLDALTTAQSPHTATVQRAEQLGAALQALVERWLRNMARPPHNATYQIAGTGRSTDDLLTVEVWKQVIDENQTIEIRDPAGLAFSLNAATLREDLGAIVPTRWSASAAHDQARAIDGVRDAQRWLRAADLGDLMHPEVPVPELDETAFDEWVVEAVDHDPLVIDLIRAKLLDRNYPLYASQFYGVTASANAVTYDVQHTQNESPDANYPLSPAEVDAVVSLGGQNVFESTGLFNIAVYDELLPVDGRLDTNLELLAAGGPDSRPFLSAYLQQGKYPDVLARRLAFFWPGIFDFAETELADKPDRLTEFVVAAFTGVNPGIDYHMSAEVQEVIAKGSHQIAELFDPQLSSERAVAALARFGIRMHDLGSLSADATAAIIQARAYEVNAANLDRVVGDADIGLDTILNLSDGTFDHLMHHFDDYLSVLDATSRPSGSAPTAIVGVVSAVERARPGLSHEIVSRLVDGLRVDDLEGVPNDVLAVLASGRRFRFTFKNVESYTEARDFDEHLIEYLGDQDGLEVPEDLPPDRREWLATKILDERTLPVATRVKHVHQLVTGVSATRSISEEPELVTALVNDGLLADSLESFEGLSRSSQAQEAFIVASTTAVDYFTSLSVAPQVAALLLKNPGVDRRIKQHITDNLPTNPAWQQPEIYEAIGDWLTEDPQRLYVETARLVVTSGVSVSTRVVVLNAAAAELGFDVVVSATGTLGDPYVRLLERSYAPVDIPGTPDFVSALAVLENGGQGPVSSWEPETQHPERVWMRHPASNETAAES